MSLDRQRSPFVYTDEQLIARFQSGDERAYIELVNRYRDRLINFVYPFLGDFEQAEDVVQETMLKLYEKKHYYREIAKFSTWIYTIARNLANTELRKKKRRKTTYISRMTKDDRQYDIPAVQVDLNQNLQNEFIRARIHAAIKELPEHFKTVIILRDIQELSYEEISKILEIPIGTIKSRINRGRIQLSEKMKHFKE